MTRGTTTKTARHKQTDRLEANASAVVRHTNHGVDNKSRYVHMTADGLFVALYIRFVCAALMRRAMHINMHDANNALSKKHTT